MGSAVVVVAGSVVVGTAVVVVVVGAAVVVVVVGGAVVVVVVGAAQCSTRFKSSSKGSFRE